MTNLEKYNQAFALSFPSVKDDALAALTYRGIPEWNSIGHMQLIAELEAAFDLVFDPEDIIDFVSYEKGKELLAKYQIAL